MKKLALVGLVGIALIGCGKKPVPVPDVPVRAAQEVKQVSVQPPKPKEVFIERYAFTQNGTTNDGKKRYTLAGYGKEYFRSLRPNEAYTEGVVGTWCYEVKVLKAGENPDYDLVTDEMDIRPDNSFTYTRSWDKLVMTGEMMGFQEFKKSQPLDGTWRLEGNSLEMRAEK